MQSALPSFDHCHVLEKVRSGPVADLFHGVQQPLGRPVLIKALSTSILPSSPFAATLEREARLLAELHHPGVLHLYDFVRRDDRMWLVLEYVDGCTLSDLLAKGSRLSVPAACAVALELARALEHAHGAGIVHRDVQPRNILLSKTGQVKLLNFTVAVDERSPSLPELLDGTSAPARPAYLSPEQILGEPADPRSDLFSLGVVLFEMLTGRRPFDGPDERSTTQRIRHDPAPPLSRYAPEAPAPVDRIVQRCLLKLPTDRYQNARDLAEALEPLLRDHHVTAAQAVTAELRQRGLAGPVAGKPESREPPPKLSAAVTLKPTLIGLVVAALAALLGGTVIQIMARSEGPLQGSGGPPRLELVPEEPAFLRVVADPWAHVVVDGQKVATTPFSRPIPLRAGTHYVRLEHPNAPVERRTVELGPGESALLDVKMAVPAPIEVEDEDPLPSEPAPDAAASP